MSRAALSSLSRPVSQSCFFFFSVSYSDSEETDEDEIIPLKKSRVALCPSSEEVKCGIQRVIKGFETAVGESAYSLQKSKLTFQIRSNGGNRQVENGVTL